MCWILFQNRRYKYKKLRHFCIQCFQIVFMGLQQQRLWWAVQIIILSWAIWGASLLWEILDTIDYWGFIAILGCNEGNIEPKFPRVIKSNSKISSFCYIFNQKLEVLNTIKGSPLVVPVEIQKWLLDDIYCTVEFQSPWQASDWVETLKILAFVAVIKVAE